LTADSITVTCFQNILYDATMIKVFALNNLISLILVLVGIIIIPDEKKGW